MVQGFPWLGGLGTRTIGRCPSPSKGGKLRILLGFEASEEVGRPKPSSVLKPRSKDFLGWEA